MSKGTPSTRHADAQEFFPRDPPREQLASIWGHTNAASGCPEPVFLNDAYAVPGLCKSQRDGESSKSCQSILYQTPCIETVSIVSYLPPPATRTSTSESVSMLDSAKEGMSGGYSEPGMRLPMTRYILYSAAGLSSAAGSCHCPPTTHWDHGLTCGDPHSHGRHDRNFVQRYHERPRSTHL